MFELCLRFRFVLFVFQNKLRGILDSRRKMQSNINARQTKCVAAAVEPVHWLYDYYVWWYNMLVGCTHRLAELQNSSFDIEEEERKCEEKVEAVSLELL